jgi:beta-1,4-mannosyl-glycoprotein beta-1,4-N-acetylglucosaminyltransferase
MKIYDCFTFNNELDLLELRLNILNDRVDFFVLVEATKTHSGEEKNLIFEINKKRFNRFLYKIIHIKVEDMPVLINNNRWVLENFQRNAIIRGLTNCEENDAIIISDLDEIPNLDSIDSIVNTLNLNSSKKDIFYHIYEKFKKIILIFNNKLFFRIVDHFKFNSSRLVVFKQSIYYYYLNGFINDKWFGSRVVLYKDLITYFKSKPQAVRNSISKNIISKGGWHFSYLFTPKEISKKIHSFAHSEYDKNDYTDINLIEERIIKGEDLFGRKDNITYVKIDNTYPKYLLENLEEYKKYIN